MAPLAERAARRPFLFYTPLSWASQVVHASRGRARSRSTRCIVLRTAAEGVSARGVSAAARCVLVHVAIASTAEEADEEIKTKWLSSFTVLGTKAYESRWPQRRG